MKKIILLISITVILLVGCSNIDQNESWYCDKIQCGNTIMIRSNITCGVYEVWDYKCKMINCTKPVKC